MVSRDDVNRLSKAQSELVRMARNELTGFFATLDLTHPEAVRDGLVEIVPLLVNEYGDMAAQAAAEWFEQVHPGTYLAQLGDTFPTEGVTEGVRYHAGNLFTDNPRQTLVGIDAALQRYIYYAGRGTVARNVALDREKPRLARVPTGAKTCAWCSLLASRGFVYLTKQTAGLTDKYHDDCDCQVVPEWDSAPAHIKGYDPDRLYDQYMQAREASGSGSDKTIAAYMRRMFPDEFTDGVTAPLI